MLPVRSWWTRLLPLPTWADTSELEYFFATITITQPKEICKWKEITSLFYFLTFLLVKKNKLSFSFRAVFLFHYKIQRSLMIFVKQFPFGIWYLMIIFLSVNDEPWTTATPFLWKKRITLSKCTASSSTNCIINQLSFSCNKEGYKLDSI